MQSKTDMSQITKQEKNVLLVLNDLCQRLQPFDPKLDTESEIDMLTIADGLKESGLSVKQIQKCWDIIKKRIRDVQKRESEFTTSTRMEVSKDFCIGQSTLFRERLRLYERSKELVF